MRELGGARERAVEQLLPARDRRIESQQRRERLLRLRGDGAVHRFLQLAGQTTELFRVRQALRLEVEPLILAELRRRRFDLLQHVPQVIGLASDLGLARRQLGLALGERPQAPVGIAHRHALHIGVGVRVEDIALRVGTQERLGLVLAVEIDQQRADFCQHADGGGRAIHPGARLPFPQHLALQHQPPLLQLDTQRSKRR